MGSAPGPCSSPAHAVLPVAPPAAGWPHAPSSAPAVQYRHPSRGTVPAHLASRCTALAQPAAHRPEARQRPSATITVKASFTVKRCLLGWYKGRAVAASCRTDVNPRCSFQQYSQPAATDTHTFCTHAAGGTSWHNVQTCLSSSLHPASDCTDQDVVVVGEVRDARVCQHVLVHAFRVVDGEDGPVQHLQTTAQETGVERSTRLPTASGAQQPRGIRVVASNAASGPCILFTLSCSMFLSVTVPNVMGRRDGGWSAIASGGGGGEVPLQRCERLNELAMSGKLNARAAPVLQPGDGR
jgi:hypothetical protein